MAGERSRPVAVTNHKEAASEGVRRKAVFGTPAGVSVSAISDSKLTGLVRDMHY